MTERMQKYRNKMKEKGLVQVRIWVEEQDEEFIKHIAKFCREVREKKEKNVMAAEQVSNRLILRRLLPSQKTFQNPIICMIIILALQGGRGVTGASKIS